MRKRERTLFRQVLQKIKSKFNASKKRMSDLIPQLSHLEAKILVEELRKAIGLIGYVTDQLH